MKLMWLSLKRNSIDMNFMWTLSQNLFSSFMVKFRQNNFAFLDFYAFLKYFFYMYCRKKSIKPFLTLIIIFSVITVFMLYLLVMFCHIEKKICEYLLCFRLTENQELCGKWSNCLRTQPLEKRSSYPIFYRLLSHSCWMKNIQKHRMF